MLGVSCTPFCIDYASIGVDEPVRGGITADLTVGRSRVGVTATERILAALLRTPTARADEKLPNIVGKQAGLRLLG
jgi:hypothetical protein